MTPAAIAVLKRKISDYIVELAEESARIAARHRADAVSAAHVEDAASYLLVSRSRRLYRHLGTVGGLLFGAALSTVLAMLTTNQLSPVGVVTSSGVGMLGAFLVALHIAKD